MTYLMTKNRGLRKNANLVAKRAALGDNGILDDLRTLFVPWSSLVMGPTPDQAAAIQQSADDCVVEQNASDTVAALDAQTKQLSDSWNPTGFYTASQIDTIMSQTSNLFASATSQLLFAPKTTSDAGYSIAQSIDDIHRKIAEGQVYVDAMNQAKSSGKADALINAPGLKMWVIRSMATVSSALVTAQSFQCNRTWIGDVLAEISTIFAHLVTVAQAIGGALVKAGDFVVKVPDALGTFLTVAKWALILGGGAFVVVKIKQARERKK